MSMIEHEGQRVGVIDVGSNSVRLVVFDGAARSPAYFFNEKVLCGLGQGLAESGRLSPEGVMRAHAALKRFALLLEHMGVATVRTVATAAVREAVDGPDFCAEVLAQTGIALYVASGEEEARLSAQGVLLGWPDASGIVCDIGGASMELARVQSGRVGPRATSPLGPLKLADFKGDMAAFIAETVAQTAAAVQASSGDRLFLVGGSWRAIARLDMERRQYPLHVLHEYKLSAAQMGETAKWVAAQDSEGLKAHSDTSSARLKLVPLAARVMGGLIDVLKPAEIAVSSYGIREGMLFEAMPPEMRALDPLIESCRYMEACNARFPGFGDALFDWLKDIFSDVDSRMVHAACLLHDTTWRAHPDYRADMCFEAVTRANMGAIDHEGRLFLAWAIKSRYSSGRGLKREMLALLSEKNVEAARRLGLAMRLGAMISGAQAVMLKNTELRVGAGVLQLTLAGSASALCGEVLEKRFENLAKAMNLEAELDFR